MLATLNSDEFVDKPPLQIHAILLERGEYVASVSTMYRVLRENRQVRERRRLATHPAWKVPELIATAAGQVFTWDTTKRAIPYFTTDTETKTPVRSRTTPLKSRGWVKSGPTTNPSPQLIALHLRQCQLSQRRSSTCHTPILQN